MSFGPFLVDPIGYLYLPIDRLERRPKPGAKVAQPWPVGPAPGWLMHKLDDEWSLQVWCALGGEWVFNTSERTTKRQLIMPTQVDPERRSRILARLDVPMRLIVSGDAFAF